MFLTLAPGHHLLDSLPRSTQENNSYNHSDPSYLPAKEESRSGLEKVALVNRSFCSLDGGVLEYLLQTNIRERKHNTPTSC